MEYKRYCRGEPIQLKRNIQFWPNFGDCLSIPSVPNSMMQPPNLNPTTMEQKCAVVYIASQELAKV
jgi:hypothetical protein